MNANFVKKDSFFALVLVALFLLFSGSHFFQSIELKAYDVGVANTNRLPNQDIRIIAIDDQSIDNIGRWPWSRDVHAKIIDILKPAKVVSNTVFFLEPQRDAGLDYINKINQKLSQSSIVSTQDGQSLQLLIEEAKNALDTDATLADSIARANNVILSMPFIMGEPLGNPDIKLPVYVTQFGLNNYIASNNPQQEYFTNSAIAAIPPIAILGEKARAIGHLNSTPDLDGVIRVEPLAIGFDGQYYPSLALQTAMQYLNLNQKDVILNMGKGVQVGKLSIATDAKLQMNSFFYANQNNQPAFTTDSFFDVYSGKISPQKYAGKIVLIGMSATGLGDRQTTPISANMPPIQTLAHYVSSILNEDFFITPAWSNYVIIITWLLVSAYLIVLLPKLAASHATVITALMAIILITMHFVFMTQYGWWVPLMIPLLLLILGHILLSTKRYLLTERSKLISDAESSDSNKNLALMLQSQGQLDMAFDRFRKCKLNDALMDALYNLGLDFERKRQFNKAEAVFNYMANYNANYKDLKSRISHARQLSETLILGAGNARAHTGLINTSSAEKPMLGRYQIEKELGKGAMGTVYLGVDPKIGRKVAIKTLALSVEFEASELEAVKARFFREAETAGKLNHPNIVTIYDAGEEHDLAYIAMELLKGHDLNQHIKPKTLLPLPVVLDLMMKVADALHYAHTQNVIHRDIKPANMMFEPETGAIKVTDFGIARISDSSKTKTGMVLGTPNFMSPEQLSGKKLDGRSDLFSLGTTMYQLVTGCLPFEGDSMANLMYKISQEDPQDILTINPQLPHQLSLIINKLLSKDTELRYQNGHALKIDIERCLEQITT